MTEKGKGSGVTDKWKAEIRISIFARHCEEQMRHLSNKKGKIDFFELREMRSFPFGCFSVSLRRRSEQIYLSFLKDFHCPVTILAAFFGVLFVVGVFVFVHALVGVAQCKA